MKKYKIIIVDDHLLFAQSLKFGLENNALYHVDSIIDDLSKVLNSVKIIMPDLVLLDVNVKGLHSKEICQQLRSCNPELKIIVISMYHEFNIIREMKNAGANGYILKNSDLDQIFKAIETVLAGNEFYENDVKAILKKGQNASEFDFEQLNPREKKILALILLAKTNKKIAEELTLSVKTIEFYRNSLYIKLDVKNIIQLVQKVQKTNYFYV